MIHKLKSNVLLFAICLLFVNCNWLCSVPEEPMDPAPVVLVYTDLSKSLDASIIDDIIDQSVSIINLYRNGADLRIASVSEGRIGEYIISNQIPHALPQESTVYTKFQEYQMKRDSILKFLSVEIPIKMVESSKSTPTGDNSCIIGSLEEAFRMYNGFSDTLQELHVYVISDFVEDCFSSPYGASLDMSKAHSQEEVLEAVTEWEPDIKLKDDSNIKVALLRVGYTTNQETQLGQNQLITSWEQILRKYGYDPSGNTSMFLDRNSLKAPD